MANLDSAKLTNHIKNEYKNPDQIHVWPEKITGLSAIDFAGSKIRTAASQPIQTLTHKIQFSSGARKVLLRRKTKGGNELSTINEEI